MYGAIIGDFAGSIYEYDQFKKIRTINTNSILKENSFYSDDTILTIAILDAIISDGSYEEYLKKYINKYMNYVPDFFPYFKTAFSPGILKWKDSNCTGKSIGNGAMMRISPIGYLFNSEDEIIKQTKLATVPSHNSDEAITYATKVALMIYYFRNGLSRKEVYSRLNINLEYNPFKVFNTTCSETFGNCMYSLYYSDSFVSAIKNTIQMGGDTDTNCAIVGSIAEAIYGVDNYLKDYVNLKLPQEFVTVLRKAQGYPKIL